MGGEFGGPPALRQPVIVEARAPRDIRRDYRVDTTTASSEFLRAWWCGVRGFQPSGAMRARYQAGYAAGVAWRDFHGPARRPHETHALDALWLHREMPDVGHRAAALQETPPARPDGARVADPTAQPYGGAASVLEAGSAQG